MKNVHDIRKEKGLFFILTDSCIANNDILISKYSIAVIVNLYYVEDAQWYLDQLYQISDIVDVYIISSNSVILDMVTDKKIHLLKKQNRGRDISALLVSSKEIIHYYDYICFLHDKKAKSKTSVVKVKSWVENMWFNMIGGRDYIQNIIGLFEKNSNIGLLIPPEPSSETWEIWGKELWRNSFEITKSICMEWGLNCNINAKIPPITIGTAFWCKVCALKKLFQRNWKYEDFEDEPLPSDGTLSHAIERIFAYVAQDAGYDTGTVMRESYAVKQLMMYQEYIPKVFEILYKNIEVQSFQQLERYQKRSNCIQEFCNKYDKIYLYGAGNIGKQCIELMKKLGIKPEGVIVSKYETYKTINGIPIFEIDMVSNFEDVGIIISVGIALKDDIVKILQEKGLCHYICFIDSDKD